MTPIEQEETYKRRGGGGGKKTPGTSFPRPSNANIHLEPIGDNLSRKPYVSLREKYHRDRRMLIQRPGTRPRLSLSFSLCEMSYLSMGVVTLLTSVKRKEKRKKKEGRKEEKEIEGKRERERERRGRKKQERT